MAAGLAIVVQSLLTKWLALYLHYLVANLVAIALASVCNFVANDRLTFRRHRPTAPDPRATSATTTPPADVHDKP